MCQALGIQQGPNQKILPSQSLYINLNILDMFLIQRSWGKLEEKVISLTSSRNWAIASDQYVLLVLRSKVYFCLHSLNSINKRAMVSISRLMTPAILRNSLSIWYLLCTYCGLFPKHGCFHFKGKIDIYISYILSSESC